MAATVTPHTFLASTANTATWGATPSFTPVAGARVIVLKSVGASVGTPGTVTGSANGLTFTQVATAVRGGSLDRLYAFVSDAVPSSPSAMTVSGGFNGDAGTGHIIFVMSCTEINGVRQWKNRDNQAIGVPSATFDATPIAGNPQISFVANAGVGGTGLTTPPSGFTKDANGDKSYTTPDKSAAYAYINSGAATATITWGTSSSTASGSIILELDASVASARKRATLVTNAARMRSFTR